ncbi:hypothetical protein WOLCODRAFT_158435 [Wolfiporia cocos MD-104 SS10]|uniref:Uncharacterized protein n=1 Tax=Wolfiporia cocos (strain MD-104) TaxID=742152 RepID=A0A2H3JQH4_WOLCO|nr:hypothetical protein WOLCODRAFT_158435 [Wolfiporia cocos MD-104 SS10]
MSNESDDQIPRLRPELYPFTAARTSGDDPSSQALLASILAAGGSIDEISNIEDFEGVERYLTGSGRASADGRIKFGLVFWLYPTGMYGPYHITEEGEVKRHGTLMTVEPGARISTVMERARAALRTEGIGHEHIKTE